MEEFMATGEHDGDQETSRTIQGKDINRRVVYAAFEMGIGREGVAKLCEILNMPFSISIDTYNHEGILHAAHDKVTKEQLKANANEAKQVAIDEGTSRNDNSSLVDIPVTFDSTWSKRGFTANHCVGFVISAATGKVLDLEVISKTCNQCSQMQARLDKETFDEWFAEHECDGSYKGSSPSMEMECAKRLWGRSIDYNLRYNFMITDGDSKSYSAVWNIYGACDTCNEYEVLEHTDKKYISWKESPDYIKWEDEHLQGTADCNRVFKLDCIGHVQKRLGKALYEYQRNATKMADGKSVKGSNGRLTKVAIEKLKTNYGKAIRNNVKTGALTAAQKDQAVKDMQTAIKAGLYHSLKIEDKERHQFCPNNSWCKFKKGLPCKDKPHHLDAVFKEPLLKIYERLSEPALLQRCLPGYTNNANESINSLVWNKCPKHKWHGSKRIGMAANAAALHFSCGATKKHDVMREAGLVVGHHTNRASERRDSGRVKQAVARGQEKHKKYRLARRQAKAKEEELRVRREGTTYEAGGFNDIAPLREPQKKKRKK